MSMRYRGGFLTANPPALGTAGSYGVSTASQQFQGKGQGLWPTPPGAPTIGVATLITTTSATVAVTAPACTGFPAGVTGYQAISTPGCIIATSGSSPVTVTGLTAGTAYTFRVRARNTVGGYGAYSASSNSVQAAVPGAPTIGTATAGGALCASVAFTAPGCVGSPGALTYTVTSTPGGVTTTGAASPLVVTGLTAATSYTFKVKATNDFGTGACSAASNSITARVATCATYTTAGTYSWVAPAGVTSVAAIAVGGGGRGGNTVNSSGCYCCCGSTVYITSVQSGGGGGGGALGYRNAVSVTPGTSYPVVVGGQATASSVFSMNAGGATNSVTRCGTNGGSVTGSFTARNSGGKGGDGYAWSEYGVVTPQWPGGGGGAGAAGYSFGGGYGAFSGTSTACSGSGGSAGGGSGGGLPGSNAWGGGGGGVGIYGQGANGVGPTTYSTGGGGGSGGTSGGISGGLYGGGGGGASANGGPGAGGGGAVRIVWAGCGRGTPSFPSTNVGA